MPPEALRLDRVEGNAGFDGKAQPLLASGTNLFALGVPDAQPEVLLWGDSHAGVLLNAVDSICRELGVSGRAVTRGRTPPIFGWSGERETTAEHQQAVATGHAVEEMLRTGTYRVVVLAFRWSYYQRRDPPLDPSRVPQGGFGEALIATVSRLREAGVRVILLEEVPIFRSHVARSAALAEWIGTPWPDLTVSDVEAFRGPYAPILQRLRASDSGLVVLDPLAFFTKDGRIEFVDEQGILLWRDQHHLTHQATERLLPMLREEISQALAD